MAKLTSKELREKAKKLLEEAVKKEQAEYIKIGKIVADFYKNGKIKDEELRVTIDNFYSKKLIAKVNE
jgi:hypothetical protein